MVPKLPFSSVQFSFSSLLRLDFIAHSNDLNLKIVPNLRGKTALEESYRVRSGLLDRCFYSLIHFMKESSRLRPPGPWPADWSRITKLFVSHVEDPTWERKEGWENNGLKADSDQESSLLRKKAGLYNLSRTETLGGQAGDGDFPQ